LYLKNTPPRSFQIQLDLYISPLLLPWGIVTGKSNFVTTSFPVFIAPKNSTGTKPNSPSVLPGLEAASPRAPIEQKSTAIWRKLTAISNFSKIPLLFRYFWSFCIG
jgi:hypothetical protein